MKLNNKGFVISTLMYALLIVFLFLLIGIITLLSNRKSILDRLKKDVKNDINGFTKYDYYPDGTVIYYNPVTNKICTDYEPENSLYETKTGCLKWYTFNDSVNSNKVNMILDHNTTYKVAWANHDDFIEAGGTEDDWTAQKYNEQGPITVTKQLREDTEDWHVTARLITADEIAHIVGADKDDTLKWAQSKTSGTNISTQVSWFFLDGSGNTYSTTNGWQKQVANSTNKSKYTWLYNYTTVCDNHGCDVVDGGTYGYWTENSVIGNIYAAWSMDRLGRLVSTSANGNNYGVRPVITVDKKNIYKQYKDDKLNGADPVLNIDMIPVTISNDGTVKKANISEEWYNYQDKRWANVVVLTNNTEYKSGAIIPESNIKAYYVWIPRYKYKLFDNNTESSIEIAFENKNTTKSNNTTVGQYLTHPAFTYGTEELNGIWVGKFETTGTSSSPTIKPYMSDNSNSTITSLRNQKVLDQYNTASSVSTNSTMMKNDEWGAVAYLSHSKYGINGKIRLNNNSGYKTGCGSSSADSLGAVAACQIEYGKATEYPQSTTGNITGIFDTSGGAWEYMMAVRADSEGKPLSGKHNFYNSGFNGKFGCPTCDSTTSGVDSSITELTSGTNFPDAKYYNLYDNPSNRNSITEANGCNGNACYGHTMGEIRKASGGTGSWYGEYSNFVSYGGPWVLRGGYCGDGASAGVFAFHNRYGDAYSTISFRVVVR